MASRFWVLVLLSILLGLCGQGLAGNKPTTAPATEAEAVTDTKKAGETLTLNFPENMDVKLLVDYVSLRLGVNILYDEGTLRKKVTITSPEKIPTDSLMGLLQSVLKMSDLVIVDSDQPGWKRIVSSKDLLSLAGEMTTDTGAIDTAGATTVITQIFSLSHTQPNEVEKIIKPFLSKPGGNSFIIPDRPLLLVTDFATNLRKVVEIINLMDRPKHQVTIQFVPVRHVDPTELARQVASHLKEKLRLEGGSGRTNRSEFTLTGDPRTGQIVLIGSEDASAQAKELIAILDVPTNTVVRTYRFSYIEPDRVEKLLQDLEQTSKLGDRYRSTIDVDSGLLVLTAPPRVHDRLEDLKEQLDVAEAVPAHSPIRFYKLLNTTAAEVLATIQSLDNGKQGFDIASLAGGNGQVPSDLFGDKRYTGPNYPPVPAGKQPPQPPFYSDEKPQATTQPADTSRADLVTTRTSNATVTADPNTNTVIVVAPPAVQNIYRQLIAMLDKRRPQVLIECTLVTIDTSDDLSLGIDMSYASRVKDDGKFLVFSSFGLSTVDVATGVLTPNIGMGFNGSIVGPDMFNAVIRAITSSGKADVLAAPRLLVNDNASATLSSVSESPFTSINASQTVSTTSFAGYASAGTTLTVTPHIAEGDHLNIQYSITLNSFTGEGSDGIPPPRQTNNISSEVTIPDGYGIIVGGLTRRDTSDTSIRIPLLGDIPILKYAFGIFDEKYAESTLFAFIRVTILRDDDFADLKYLSDRDLALAQQPPNYPTSELKIME